jgi:hypothetical protein
MLMRIESQSSFNVSTEGGNTMAVAAEGSITREFYDAFQRAEFDRFDAILAEDFLVNSPAGFGVRLDTFKEFAVQFTDLAYQIDLVDEHLALDENGSGRGFITFCLYWKHTKDFGGVAPTGREGTSVETALFTIVENQITRMDVAINTLDLGIYEWERGFASPHNVRPDAIITGIDRREATAVLAG